jgi:hypothetical protein
MTNKKRRYNREKFYDETSLLCLSLNDSLNLKYEEEEEEENKMYKFNGKKTKEIRETKISRGEAIRKRELTSNSYDEAVYCNSINTIIHLIKNNIMIYEFPALIQLTLENNRLSIFKYLLTHVKVDLIKTEYVCIKLPLNYWRECVFANILDMCIFAFSYLNSLDFIEFVIRKCMYDGKKPLNNINNDARIESLYFKNKIACISSFLKKGQKDLADFLMYDNILLDVLSYGLHEAAVLIVSNYPNF